MTSWIDEQTSIEHKIDPVQYAKIAQALSCNCIPYEEVMTYNRWKSKGYQVQRGEKAIRIEGIAPVFCRCQVLSSDNGKQTHIL